MNHQHYCKEHHAAQMLDWIRNRGGVAIWQSHNLSNPDKSWSTPALTDGQTTTKPAWECASTPERIITSTDDILVTVDREIKRFHVTIRPASNNPFVTKVSDGGARRIRAAVAKAGNGAYHTFDYTTQEAIIMAPVSMVTLTEWARLESGKVVV